jgi:hypothetical protein
MLSLFPSSRRRDVVEVTRTDQIEKLVWSSFSGGGHSNTDKPVELN